MAWGLALQTACTHVCRSMQHHACAVQPVGGVEGFMDTSSAVYLTGVIGVGSALHWLIPCLAQLTPLLFGEANTEAMHILRDGK